MFNEVTADDGHREFMVHLNEDKNPIRIYTYKDFLDDLNNQGYELDGKSAEKEVYTAKNWEQNSTNTLFVDFVGDVKHAYIYLRKYVSCGDLETN